MYLKARVRIIKVMEVFSWSSLSIVVLHEPQNFPVISHVSPWPVESWILLVFCTFHWSTLIQGSVLSCTLLHHFPALCHFHCHFPMLRHTHHCAFPCLRHNLCCIPTASSASACSPMPHVTFPCSPQFVVPHSLVFQLCTLVPGLLSTFLSI